MRRLALGAAGLLFVFWLAGTIILKVDPSYGAQPTPVPIATTRPGTPTSIPTRVPTPVPRPTSVGRPEVGSQARVWADGLAEWHFAVDRSSLDQWNKGVQARDTVGLQQLINSGKAFAVADGTPVLVLEQDFTVTQIRVMAGPQKDRAGWVNFEHVR